MPSDATTVESFDLGPIVQVALNEAERMQLERAAAAAQMSTDAFCGAICAREVFNTYARDGRRARKAEIESEAAAQTNAS